ncbi:mechanosensitive ion channel family protein [Pseudodesulfovibrio sp.]|nr:mechanosensitive ion channel family protein [Pseudodesulfovibrio sp.]
MDLTTPIILIESNPLLDITAKIGVVLLAALIAFGVTKLLIVRAVHAFAERSASQLDDILMKEGVFSRAALLAPAPVLFWGAELFPEIKSFLPNLIYAYLAVAVVMVLTKALNGLGLLYQTFDIAKRRPIKGYVQLLKLFIYILGAVSVVSILLGKSPWGLLSGIGAMTAVLMLVFKDTILSLVAGIQIAANDLLQPGDWIEMPAMNADGDVIDVALNTVKIQNFDKTITAVPTYKFLDTAFKNWRGMERSGGRRIKRSLMIDQSSITFADTDLIERLKKVQNLAPYIEERLTEIETDNAQCGANPDSLLNGRRLTNIGLFRRYTLEYLRNHKSIRKDMTLLVRQLQPDASKGLPVEIYCFTTDTNWNIHEAVQADIFDHLLAALPQFSLKAYQRNALVDGRGCE